MNDELNESSVEIYDRSIEYRVYYVIYNCVLLYIYI